jgi:hypothetical protein
MFESLSRGWSLTKTSFKVLKLDKEILTLPILSGVIFVLLTVSFVVPFERFFGFERLTPAAMLAIFGFYVLLYFVAIFFNAAVIECAMIRFNGGDPVVRDGLRKAWQHKGRILQWAIVAATVGLILKILENMARNAENELTRILGQIAVGMVGAAWNIATYFVVPALIYQDIGPFDALRASVGTWRRAWGEGFTATFTTGMIFFLLGLVGLLPLFIGVSLIGTSVALGFGLIAVALLYWVLLAAVNSAVDGIVTAAIYKYAVDGRLPEAFADAPVPSNRGRPAYYA